MNYVKRVLIKSYYMADMETRKLLHDPTELVTRTIQPILWLGIFGEALSKVRAIPTQGLTYLQFITPGILTQSVVFIAIFYGLSTLWERDSGILQKFLVTPTPHLAFVWGKMASAGIRGISQIIVIFLIALLLRIQLNFILFSFLVLVIIVFLVSCFFCGLLFFFVVLVSFRDRFIGFV